MVSLGAIAAYALNYGLSIILDPLDPLLFTLPFGLQAVPAILLGLGMCFMPQSPRWLISRGRERDARKALGYIRGYDVDSAEIEHEIRGYEEEHRSNSTSTWKGVFSKENIPRLMVGVPLILFQQFLGRYFLSSNSYTGMNALNYFAPQIFRDLGVTGKSGDLFATGIIGVVKLSVSIPAILYIDRSGRYSIPLIGPGVSFILSAQQAWSSQWHTSASSTN
jgi:SP family arabinose:H+ symporter-like MFS transporter